MTKRTLIANTRAPGIKAHQLRKEGYTPGVIYGKDIQTSQVIIESKSLNSLLKQAGNSVLFEIAMESYVGPVRVKEVQRDPVTKDIIHVDIQAVNEKQKVKAHVPIRIQDNHEASRRGIVIQRQKDTVLVEGLPQNIPPQLNITVRGLRQGGNIRIGDLEVSEELSIIDNSEDIVLSAVKGSKLEIESITEGDHSQENDTDDQGAEG